MQYGTDRGLISIGSRSARLLIFTGQEHQLALQLHGRADAEQLQAPAPGFGKHHADLFPWSCYRVDVAQSLFHPSLSRAMSRCSISDGVVLPMMFMIQGSNKPHQSYQSHSIWLSKLPIVEHQ